MSERTTITLQPSNLEFLDSVAGGNRSSFINRLIEKERRWRLKEAVLKANLEEAGDEAYLKEYALWDATIMDGLEDE